MAVACATAACARGGDDDGNTAGDDGGVSGQDTGASPPTSDGSTRDSTARDTSVGEAASDDGTADVGAYDGGGSDGTGDPDSQTGDDGAMDSGPPMPPDTGPGPGMDSGIDTGIPVQDAGRETSTNLPSCTAAYDQANCEGYLTGTTQVSSSSHNWLCITNCQDCAASSACAPGQTGCPWGNVWTDKGACH
jgi:hypothetical protein